MLWGRFAYMPILSAIGLAYGIRAIFGSQLVAALLLFYRHAMGRIRKYFPPIVSGTVVLSIGLSLTQQPLTIWLAVVRLLVIWFSEILIIALIVLE